jgi:hypothetical protein
MPIRACKRSIALRSRVIGKCVPRGYDDGRLELRILGRFNSRTLFSCRTTVEQTLITLSLQDALNRCPGRSHGQPQKRR